MLLNFNKKKRSRRKMKFIIDILPALILFVGLMVGMVKLSNLGK
jgi:hypothetical protein